MGADVICSPLQVVVNHGVIRVKIDHPPLNLLDAALMAALDAFASEMEQRSDARVIVFASGDPDFFVPHGDMSIVEDPDSFARLPVAQHVSDTWNPMMRLHERIRTLPQVTIGVLRGAARGGGAELFSAMDLRYASLERGKLAQMEAPTGIIPGAGATAYLPRMVGRARALEIILGARTIDAATAERWGWVNRALPDADLDEFVDELAADIAALPDGVASAALSAVDSGATAFDHSLTVENDFLGALFARPAATQLTRAALGAGAQTRQIEQDLDPLLQSLRDARQSPAPSTAGLSV